MRCTKRSDILERVADALHSLTSLRRVPAFLNETVRQRFQSRRLQRLFDEMEAEAGPIPAEIQQSVDALPWPE